MKQSKKDIRVMKEVKRALDEALAEGTISKDVYDLINRPGLETRNKNSNWDDDLLAPEPEPKAIPAPEIAAPEPEPEAIPAPEIAAPEPEPEEIAADGAFALELESGSLPDMEDYEEAVPDDAVPEGVENISQATAPGEVAESAPGTSIGGQVELRGDDETAKEETVESVSLGTNGSDSKEVGKGVVFTACFRCGRMEIAQYADKCIPKDVKGECKDDNGIVMILCGDCREVDASSNDAVTSPSMNFEGLRLSPKLLQGSIIQRAAGMILGHEVAFITDEGGIAYRDVDGMMSSLKKDDNVMSVDMKRFENGERTGLKSGFLAGGLISRGGGDVERKEIEGKSSKDGWEFGMGKEKARWDGGFIRRTG